MSEKAKAQIEKLARANADLQLKIAGNARRIRSLVGEVAGVKEGDVVVSKGVRYHVVEVLSDSLPKRGQPSLSGLKIAKNGNIAKNPVTIDGAWSAEKAAAAAASAPKRRGRPPKEKPINGSDAAPKKRGRPRKVVDILSPAAGTA